MLIDLQLHSTYSDGYLTPTKLVEFIAAQNVKVASLTDHNTVRGLDEFRQACRKHKIKPITGIELYVKLGNRRLGILWYNFDDKDPELHDILRYSQARRRNQVRYALKKLLAQGFRINISKVLDKYNHYVPLNHVVDEIYSLPFNRRKIKRELRLNNPREGEIIARYFRNNKVSALHESYIDIRSVLNCRKGIGGQIILNHPAKHSYIRREAWEKFKKAGIDGVEILSPHHSIGAIMLAQHLAKEFKFIQTGGSDFHRFERGKALIKNSWQYYKIDSKYLRKINKIIG